MSQFGSQLHGKSDRVLSGSGKLKHKKRDKRRHEMGGYFANTRLGDSNKSQRIRRRGGITAERLKYAAYANLLTQNGYKKARIKSVLESKDNRNFARLKIVTKGSLIETEFGKAVVINRPGREGLVNARLVIG